MKKKKILLITDHKWRDLPGYVYLKHILENTHSLTVRLCNLGDEKFYAWRERPDAVVFNNMFGQERVQFARWLKKQGIQVLVLLTEGIPFKTLDLVAGKFTDLDAVDLFFCWNRPVADRMLELGKITPDRLRIVGVPRFDFYFPPLNRLLLGKSEVQKKYGLVIKKDVSILLLATNFTIASQENSREFLYRDWKNLGVTQLFGEENIDRLVELDVESRRRTLGAVEKLLQDFPQIQILYKPHPSENHLFYAPFFAGLKDRFPGRTSFVTQEYIWDMLHVSDILLQRTCTTAIEAWVMKKPTLQLNLNPDEFYLHESHIAGSDVVENYEKLAERVKHYIGGGAVSPFILENRRKFIDTWCSTMDGKRTEHVATLIAESVKAKREKAFRYDLEGGYRFLKEWAKKACRDQKRNLQKKQADFLGRIDKRFSERDTREWASKIMKGLYDEKNDQ